MSVEMVTRIYEMTQTFPPDERFGLTSQIRRAAVSVPANIAEGAARQHHKEFVQFLCVAQGSTSELETEILIARNLGYVDDAAYSELSSEINSIARMLIGLANHVRSRGC